MELPVLVSNRCRETIAAWSPGDTQTAIIIWSLWKAVIGIAKLTATGSAAATIGSVKRLGREP